MATIKYFHPSIDDSHPELWDNTALAAIPGAIAAESTEQFVSAARAMVGTLGDPVTRVERADSRPRRTSLFMAAYEEFARSARSN